MENGGDMASGMAKMEHSEGGSTTVNPINCVLILKTGK